MKRNTLLTGLRGKFIEGSFDPRIIYGTGLFAIGLLFLFAVATGWCGVDFGWHWDEPMQLGKLQQTLETGSLITDNYIYPSMIAWLTYLPMVDNVLLARFDETTDLQDLQAFAETNDYKLEARRVFVVVTNATILVVALGMWLWKRSIVLAVFSAALLTFSWEVAYHARWIAADGILMFFATCTTVLLLWKLEKPKTPYVIWLAALTAGFATSTKYPGGILLLSIWLAAYQIYWGQGLRVFLSRIVGLSLVFGLSYLIITPGTLLDAKNFFSDVTYVMGVYSTQGWFRYTAASFTDHLLINLSYFSQVVFSPVRGFAVVLFGFSLVGVYTILRRERHLAGILLVVPGLYFVYMTKQSVAVVRNQLLMVPVLVLWISLGVWTVYRALPRYVLKIALSVVLVVILAVNASMLVARAQSIANRDAYDGLAAAEKYINGHPDTLFYLSEGLLATETGATYLAHDNVVANVTDDFDQGMFFYRELRGYLPANQPNLIARVFGPYEVNLNYYSDWGLGGDERILLLTHENLVHVLPVLEMWEAWQELAAYQDVLIVGGGSTDNSHEVWSARLQDTAETVREVVVADGGIAVLPEGPFAVLTAPGAEPLTLYATDDPALFLLFDGVRSYRVDSFEAAPSWDGPALTAISPARFANDLTLTGYALDDDHLYVEWLLPDANPDAGYLRYFGHLLDANGDRLGQRDGDFWPGSYWRAGDRLILWIPLEEQAEAITLRLGLYQVLDDGVHGLDVVDDAGNAAAPWVDVPLR